MMAALGIGALAMVAIVIQLVDQGADEFQVSVAATPPVVETEEAELTPTPEATPTETPPIVATFTPISEAPISRMVIALASVDHAVVALPLPADGVLSATEEPGVIAYYDFSARPGDTTGNALFGGSADGVQDGVFANLPALSRGDQIVIELEDGAAYSYEVFSVAALGGGPVDPSDAGCAEPGCPGLGTLTLIGFNSSGSGHTLVRGQLSPG
ncbi:MAG: sortase [Dehalococcoidia bacterium]|nr:sortase [Dehalococcoidia bacterium]